MAEIESESQHAAHAQYAHHSSHEVPAADGRKDAVRSQSDQGYWKNEFGDALHKTIDEQIVFWLPRCDEHRVRNQINSRQGARNYEPDSIEWVVPHKRQYRRV